MAKEKRLGKFFVYCILILALFLVMIPLAFSLGGRLMRLELITVLVLMLLTLIGFAGYNKRWGERVLFVMFWLNLANIAAIWVFRGEFYLLALFLTLLGFVMSMPRKQCYCCVDVAEGEPHSMVLEAPAPPVEIIEAEPEVKEEKKVETKFDPGKYVASKMGSVYHVATCSWAKKIAKNRQLWFKDKREANRKGYKAHNCV